MTFANKSRTVLAVDLDYFYAQCEELREPRIKDKPVVVCVYSGRTVESGAVSTCNYLARSLGVKSGIPIALAKKMLSNYPNSAFLPMDKNYYEEVSERIMTILRSHSSLIEQVSVDEAYLDISENTKGDFSTAKFIGAQIKSEILVRERLTCSVGVGPNKLIAKMAVDAKKPDGLTVIEPSNVKYFLDPLPVGKLLGIGPKNEQKLEKLGIKNIGELANTDEAALIKEFGKHLGPHLKRFAQGIDEEPVHEKEVEQISRIVTLKCDTSTFNFADDLRRISEDISNKLIERGTACKTVGIIAITTELKTKSRAKTLDNPSNSAKLIEDSARGLFETFFGEGPNDVRRIGVKVGGFVASSETRGSASLMDFFG